MSVVVFLILYTNKKSGKKTTESIPISKPQLVLTDEFIEILDVLKNTDENLFITGKAGTGKSTFLKHFIKSTNKKLVILAPTTIEALNVSGQTIHSFFRFPPFFINPNLIEPDFVRAELFKNLEMVVIDGISMVRSDLMNGIDIALRKNKNKPNEPFGGIQMVFIGDLFQLPPELSIKDSNYLTDTYGGQYFFDAPVFKTFNYQFKELTTMFRQSGEQPEFKTLLNNIRNNEVHFNDMALLNSRHKDNVGEQENSICLTTRRSIARNINKDKLEGLPREKVTYIGELSGKYLKFKNEVENKLEGKFPAPYKLELKKGAQIMMLKNDDEKRWVNGSIGIVEKLESDAITVNINDSFYRIERESWNEIVYVVNKDTKEIEERTVAGFSQFPLQLSYALTIHKSHGKTFDRITVDIGTGIYVHGQVYVALSRCRTLEGITLKRPIRKNDIIVDPRVSEFYRTKYVSQSTAKKTLNPCAKSTPIIEELLKAINGNNKIKILYENFNGESSERQLSDLKLSEDFNDYSYDKQHVKGFCLLRNEERSFKIDRIKRVELIS